MAQQSQTRIKIGNREIDDYKSLSLRQELNEHHTLELVLSLKNLEKDSESFAFESKKFLGEMISVQINTLAVLDINNGMKFQGIITKIRNTKGTDDFTKDEVHFTAKSPTVLIDDGPNYNSYSQMSITELVDKTILEYGESIMNFEINPMEDTFIPYSVQSNESSYKYLLRVAAQYGEWFYYDGTQLIFGNPNNNQIVLKRNIDLMSFDIELQPKSHNYKYFSSDYLSDSIVEKSSADVGSTGCGYNAFVNEKAAKIYQTESKIWHHVAGDSDIEKTLENNIAKQKASTEINQVILSGISDNPAVKLGGIVLIEDIKYRVISLRHIDEKSGMYRNKFKAICVEIDEDPYVNNTYCYTDIGAFPLSQPQSAVVMENDDPEGLGRVKVQFPWQLANGDMTPWLRIASPHAGPEKGIQFIPEIGEEVLIGFEGGNAERPFMYGSLYNGSAKSQSWATANNDNKVIRTKSGNSIVFNDGDGSITIVDPSGNTVIMDGSGNIITSSPESTEFISGDSKLTMKKDGTITIEAGTTIRLDVAGGCSFIEMTSGGITMEGENINLEGISLTELKGGGSGSVTLDGEAVIEGTQVKLNS